VSLAIKYESVEDATMRLRNTVVLYKGDPVLIKEIRPGDDEKDILRVLFQPLPLAGGEVPGRIGLQAEEEQKRKYISSKHFDIAPIKLGYVNGKDFVFFCSRLPNRIQKQGLCSENFSGKMLAGPAVGFNTFLTCKESVDTIKGNYPSFIRSLELLERVPAVAFSREFCLVRDDVIPHLVYLYHKNVKVGYYSKDEVSIGKKFECLKERLNEMHLKVGVC